MDNLFAQLRHHARTAPTSVAVLSRYRPITYRKLWSRLERATARVQSEWQVLAGDTVVYMGAAHPDALLLYLALARSGALLLPLALANPSDAAKERLGTARRLIVDDSSEPDDVFWKWSANSIASPLSALIDQPCAQQPIHILEDMGQPSLIPATWESQAACVTAPLSLAGLWQQYASSRSAQEKRVPGCLFTPSTMGEIVVPTLLAGDALLIG